MQASQNRGSSWTKASFLHTIDVTIFITRQRSCGKVMFLQVSVILFGMGGGVSLVPDPFLVTCPMSLPGKGIPEGRGRVYQRG